METGLGMPVINHQAVSDKHALSDSKSTIGLILGRSPLIKATPVTTECPKVEILYVVTSALRGSSNYRGDLAKVKQVTINERQNEHFSIPNRHSYQEAHHDMFYTREDYIVRSNMNIE